MAPIPTDTFADRLRALPPDRTVAFVADLWRARGYETHRAGDGETVIASRDGNEQRLLIHRDPGRVTAAVDRLFDTTDTRPRPTTPTDVVVTTASARRARRLDAEIDARVIGIETLRELLLYAIDPECGDTLCQRYLGRPARRSAEAESTDWAVAHGGRLVVLGVIAVTVLVVTGGLVGTPGTAGFFGVGAQSTGLGGSSGETPMATVQGSVTPTAPSTATPAPTPDPPSLPPGVDETGLSDPEALIDAHMQTIVGRSYTWRLTYQVFVRDTQSIDRQEVIQVRRQSRYVTNVSGNSIRTDPADPTATVSAYGGGGFRYTKNDTADTTRYRRTALTFRNDRSRYEVRARVLLAKFLWGNHSTRVSETRRDGEQVYILTLVETAADENASTTTRAIIEPDGFIRSLQWKSVDTGEDQITVVISYRYTDVGSTTVEAPPWYPAAKNATATR